MQQQPNDHVRLAHSHVCAALEGLERTIHEAYADAAYDARITNYGNICARRTLLHRIRADLALVQQSVSSPSVLAAD